MAVKRFASNSDEEIARKRQDVHAKNTMRANKRASNILKDYLREKQQDPNFENVDAFRLSEILSHFYTDARTAKGEYYKASSLENFRHSLNRYLNTPPFNKNIDIIKDVQFNDANANFKAALAELKRMGKGNIDHHPMISEDDRRKLYQFLFLSPNTPSGLLNKVQFDIRLYFFRRGRENMQSMTKDTFQVKRNDSGLKYVEKTEDELTKNHRESDRETFSAIMPESPGDTYCPVASFEKYLSKLHPNCPRLCQRPKEMFFENDEVWYCNSGVGEKSLSTFMSKLSKDAKLSTVYTNHSIRATGASILSEQKFGAAQIMSVTGHKSVSSLAVYPRVRDNEKIAMGRTLTAAVSTQSNLALTGPSTSEQRALPPPTGPTTTPLTTAVATVSNRSDEFSDDDTDLAMLDIDSIFQRSQVCLSSSSSMRMPVFYNCIIGSMNITINK